MKTSVYRYNPEADEVPYLQHYDFEPPGQRDLMVLDVSAISRIEGMLVKEGT